MRNQPDRESIPAVQRIRLRYAKRGPLKFSSHRDFQRAFERAVRRTGVPMAYSAGFSPHPKISYANAAPTSTASEAEYVEIALTEKIDPAQLVEALAVAMPAGLPILEAVEARSPDFVNRLEAGVWRVELPNQAQPEVERAIEAFLAQTEVVVTRKTKNGPRAFDVRSAVLGLRCEGVENTETGHTYAILRLVIRHSAPAVRPDDVLNGIAQISGLQAAARVTRLAQGPLVSDQFEVGDPLELDRTAI